MSCSRFLNEFIRSSRWGYLAQRQQSNGPLSKEAQIKSRRRYALFGGIVMMYFGSHAVLLWRRRSEYRAMNKEMPPISYDEFEKEFLLQGKVQMMVIHPNFGVVDCYLQDESGKSVKDVQRTMLQDKTIFGQKFYQKPQVRFTFRESPEVLEQLVLDAQKTLAHPSEISFEVNSFPSYRELAFITGSVLFGACCVGLMKI